MTDDDTAQSFGERLARETWIDAARHWHGEMAKIGEHINDPQARWELLRRALAQIGGLD